jgi:flagellar biosynthesis/type III secretory pathway protein FliH
MSLTETEREVYEAHLKWLRDEEMALLTAHNKGVEEGMQKGRAEGLEEGLQRGEEKGRQEGLATALQRLIDSGVPEAEAKRLLQIN